MAKLLADPNEHVREAAISALVEAYRHVGERVRTDLSKMSGTHKRGVYFVLYKDTLSSLALSVA